MGTTFHTSGSPLFQITDIDRKHIETRSETIGGISDKIGIIHRNNSTRDLYCQTRVHRLMREPVESSGYAGAIHEYLVRDVFLNSRV